MNGIEYYIERFRKLKTAYSKSRPAPHKALLLLSVIELIQSGVITSPKIRLSDTLVNTFNSNSRQLFQDDFFKPSIGQPFFFMKSEPFWNLVAEDTADIELKTTSYSVKNLQSRICAPNIDMLSLTPNFSFYCKIGLIASDSKMFSLPNILSNNFPMTKEEYAILFDRVVQICLPIPQTRLN